MAVTFQKFYKGFSTRWYEDAGASFANFNLDCVTEDLLNEIFTIKGERIMMPEFGTRIPLLTFEINDIYVQDVIREDIESVINGDPRVELISLAILPDYDRYALVAIATIRYIEFNVTKDLRIEVTSK